MSWRDSCSAIVSGVLMSVDLQLDQVVRDSDRKGLDGYVGRKGERLARLQVEEGAVARAFERACLGVDLAVGENAVVVRAAILDRIQRALDVEHGDLEILVFDDPVGTGRKLGKRADVDDGGHG